MLAVPRECYRPHISGRLLYLVNAGFHHLLIYDLETLEMTRYPLSHLLGEHYTLIWLSEYHALSIGPKSWAVSLTQRTMDRIWTTDPVLHFAFGAGLNASKRLYLVGGVNACQEDFDSDLETAAEMHASGFCGIVEVTLNTMRREVYRGVLPKTLIRPAVLWLEIEHLLVIMGGMESLDTDNPIISMDVYLFSPLSRRIQRSGQLPGFPSLIQSCQIAGNHIYAVFESGEVLDCDLNTGLGVRFWLDIWLQRKLVLWCLPFTHIRIPLGVLRVVLCDFLASKLPIPSSLAI